MARMGRSCRSGSGWIFGLLLLLISTSVGQNTTRAKEYQPEGCLRCIVFTWPCKCKAWFARGRWGNGSINLVIIRCGQPCLQAAENTLLPCITAAVGEAMACEFKTSIEAFLQSWSWDLLPLCFFMTICCLCDPLHSFITYAFALAWNLCWLQKCTFWLYKGKTTY